MHLRLHLSKFASLKMLLLTQCLLKYVEVVIVIKM